MRICVYFGDDGVGGLGIQLAGGRPLGLERLAVTTPRRIKFNEHVFAAVDHGIEVRRGENDDVSGGKREQSGKSEKPCSREHSRCFHVTSSSMRPSLKCHDEPAKCNHAAAYRFRSEDDEPLHHW